MEIATTGVASAGQMDNGAPRTASGGARRVVRAHTAPAVVSGVPGSIECGVQPRIRHPGAPKLRPWKPSLQPGKRTRRARGLQHESFDELKES